jgi:hypothetical protein
MIRQNSVWTVSWTRMTAQFGLEKLSNTRGTRQMFKQWPKLGLWRRGARSNIDSTCIEQLMALTLKLIGVQKKFCATELWNHFICVINIFPFMNSRTADINEYGNSLARDGLSARRCVWQVSWMQTNFLRLRDQEDNLRSSRKYGLQAHVRIPVYSRTRVERSARGLCAQAACSALFALRMLCVVGRGVAGKRKWLICTVRN